MKITVELDNFEQLRDFMTYFPKVKMVLVIDKEEAEKIASSGKIIKKLKENLDARIISDN